MRRTIFSEDFNAFKGTGIASDPLAGQLDSDVWTVSGFGDPDADAARGTTSGGVTTGGLYAVMRGAGDSGLLIQPSGSDFTPGDLTIRLDAGDAALTDVMLSFDRLVQNDQPRANSFDLSVSLDGSTYAALDAFTSGGPADMLGLMSQTVTVALPDLAAGAEIFLQWTGDDTSGAGSRDEFGLDNILVAGDTADAPLPAIVINEVLASTTSTDSEYVELFGPAGASLAGLSFVSVESDPGTSTGEIEFRYDFADDAVIGLNGFYLIANETARLTYGVTPNAAFTASIEKSSATYALVETASLTGTFVAGGEVVRDAVANVDNADDAATTFFGAPVVGPDGSFLPAGVGRIVDGVDTDTAADFRILNFFNDSPPNTPTAGTGDDDGGGDGGGGNVTVDDAPTVISAIQGAGDTSPLVGARVVVEAIVTADFQSGDADEMRSLDGFFLMEQGADRDDDAATSEGLFAYEGGDTRTDVSEGDLVRVLGTVVERFGQTAIEVDEIRIERAAAADPLSLAVETMLPDTFGREAFEGMLIRVPEPLTFSESFDYEAFGAATLSTDGPVYQFT